MGNDAEDTKNEAEYWEGEALRYAQNAEFWRKKASKPSLTISERQRAYKARHRAAGRKEVRNLWAHPDDVPAIKALADKLNGKRGGRQVKT